MGGKLNAGSVPIDCDFINFVEDWLVQHIMNTDFGYRGHLVHDVPAPFTWDTSFRVFYERLDDEHKGLFDCIRDCVEHPSDEAKFNFCKTKIRMHFDYEEHEFCNIPDYNCYGHYLKHYNFMTKFQSAHLPLTQEVAAFGMNWLSQHIKNTDFTYRGKLHVRRVYDIPEPFTWDESFKVEIERLDAEHKVLFDTLRDVEAARGSQANWESLLTTYVAHFVYEESQFSTILDADFDPADHKVRHDAIVNTLKGVVVPVSEEVTNFIKNWLVQHIKNTDFKYKGTMPVVHAIPEPFRWTSYYAVLYEHMDTEYKHLFDCLAQVEATPGDAALVTSCLKSYEDHFRHEESLLKVVDYTKEKVDEVFPGGYFDLVYDTATGSGAGENYFDVSERLLNEERKAKNVILNGGPWTWISYFIGLQKSNRKLLLTDMNTRDLEELAKMFDTKVISRPVIFKTFPLDAEGVKEAFDVLQSRRTVGKIFFLYHLSNYYCNINKTLNNNLWIK